MDNWTLYALAHRGKGGGGGTVKNPALRLIDWEGTVLKEYTAAQVASLTELPVPSSLSTKVDRELLTFQGWNWLLTDIKTWVTTHENECLNIGAIYTTTDGTNHNSWNNPLFENDMRFVVEQKRGTTGLSSFAFRYCTLLQNINIPDGTENIGDYTFQYCVSLKNLNIPKSITSIGTYALQECSDLKNVNIPKSITSIGNYAFQYCASLESVNLPDSVMNIGALAFQSCTSLKQIHISTSVTNIANYTFQYCVALQNIVIPTSVITIGSFAFQYCTAINGIVIYGMPELTNVNAFSGIYSSCLYYVPRANLSWFETATNWATFYAQDKIVAIEDNVDFLRAIGIDV